MTATAKGHAQRAEWEEKRRRALDLRKQGLSYWHIGQEMGISKQAVQNLIQKALKDIAQPAAGEMRELINARFDDLLHSLYSKAIEEGDQEAANKIRLLEMDRAKLYGLLTEKVEHTGAGGGPVQIQVLPDDPDRTANVIRILMEAGALVPSTGNVPSQ